MHDKKTICLNMIVKNESHIIEKTFDNILEYVPLDYWVIADTGSTDNTREVIKSYFEKKGIKGELHEQPWKDFGHNRSESLRVAYNKSDYLLIFDADDSFHGNFKLPTPMKHDRYKLKFGPGFTYYRPLLINNRKRFKFVGVLHEYLAAIDPVSSEEPNIEGNYYVESGRLGDRSKDKDKYLKDAMVLKKGYEDEKDKDYGLACRYAFYCAQSFKDCGKTDESIEWYRLVVEKLSNWSQEKYYSCVTLGNMYKDKGDFENALKFYLKSTEYDPERIEGVAFATTLLREKGFNDLVMMIYNEYKKYNKNPTDKLFLFDGCYKDEIEFNTSVCAFYTQKKNVGYECAKKVLSNKIANPGYIHRTFCNLPFYGELIEKDSEGLDLFYGLDDYVQQIMRRGGVDEGLVSAWNNIFEKQRKNLTQEGHKHFKHKKGEIKVFLSFTSCKRFDLFEQTVNSIMNHWKDADKINYWFCVDDNSSEGDRTRMRKKYPWIHYYMKNDKEKGHRESMNIIWNKLNELKPKYWIHMEDDFLFHTKKDFVTESIRILDKYDSQGVKQILYNRGYAETMDDTRIQGFEPLEDGFVMHVQKSGQFPYPNCHYWPHYSFRPSMTNVEAVLGIGNYDSPNTFFEMDYANRWVEKGYKSAFFNGIHCRHIGRLTKERNNNNVKNAYQLNNEAQFNGQTPDRPTLDCDVKCINLDRREDRMTYMRRECPFNLERFSAIDGKRLFDYENTAISHLLERVDGKVKVLGEIGCTTSHYSIWKNVKDMTIILEDDAMFNKDSYQRMKKAIGDIKCYKDDWDIVFIAGQWTPNFGLNEKTHMECHTIKDEHIGTVFIPTGVDGLYARKNEFSEQFSNPLYRTTAGYIISKKGAETISKLADDENNKFMDTPLDMWILNMERAGKLRICDYLKHPIYQGGFDLVKENCLLQTDIARGQGAIVRIKGFGEKELLEKFDFYPQKDQIGNDMQYVGKKPLVEMLRFADSVPNCVGFNTLGFFKNKVDKLENSPYFGTSDGIYVKKSCTSFKKYLPLELDKSKYDHTTVWYLTSGIKTHLAEYLDLTQKNTILEIGSFEGLSACGFSDNCMDHPESTLDCVDPFMPDDIHTPVTSDTEIRFRKNIANSKHADKISVHKMLSQEFFKTNTKRFNMIYVDGSHVPEDILFDMEESFKVLEEDGIMWMDDYLGGDDKEKIIKKTMDSFVEKHKSELQVIYSAYQLAIRKNPTKKLLFVGANDMNELSKYVKEYRDAYFIEAIPGIAEHLEKRLNDTNAQHGTNYKALCKLITNEENKEYTFHITSNNCCSSSIYEPKENWDWPWVKKVQETTLTSTRMASILKEIGWTNKKFDVVIDVQGAELEVLKSFDEYLDNIECIQVEASAQEFYKGQSLVTDVHNFMYKNKFVLIDEFANNIRSVQKVKQGDLIYARNPAHKTIFKNYQYDQLINKPKLTRVKMLGHYWPSSKEIVEEFCRMNDGKFEFKNIELTDDDEDIDYYVIINMPKPGDKYDPARTLVFQMEPCAKYSAYGTHTWGEWANPDKSKFMYVNDYENHLNVVQWRFKLPETFEKKHDKVASIISRNYHYVGHKYRVDFAKFLQSKYPGLLDVYGRDNTHNLENHKGPLENDDPSTVLAPYKYYFMTENNEEKNYATEKIWEPILCESLCFYWGCPNLEDYIDSKAFVRLPMDNFDEAARIIKKAIDEDWWSQRIGSIRQEKQKILESLGFLPMLNTLLDGRNKCVFTGCVMNCEKHLDKVFANIQKLIPLFSDYKIVLYYDESTDKTHEKITEYSKHLNIELLHDPSYVRTDKFRTENIEHARNEYMNYIRSNCATWEYMIAIDMDDVCGTNMNIENLTYYLTPQEVDKWDCLTFNRRNYYDSWAVSLDPLIIGCWQWVTENPQKVIDLTKKYITDKIAETPENELLDCHSAFNGFGIYKLKKFMNCKYSANIESYIGTISPEIVKKNVQFLTDNKITVDESKFVYHECEHRSFHLQAKNTNNAKIKISPKILFDEPDETYCELVSSRGILKSCDVRSNVLTSSIRQFVGYDLSTLKDGDVLYVCGSAIPSFVNGAFKTINKKIVLVSGDCDEDIYRDILSDTEFEAFISSDKILHWFTQNCVIEHPKVSRIPIGLDYHTLDKGHHATWGNQATPPFQEDEIVKINRAAKPLEERLLLCYSNFHFSMNTKYGFDRKDVLASIPKDIVFFEKEPVQRVVSWITQSKFAFVLSPHGNGLDCHRTWEALALGCIPIVKSSPIDSLFDHLPVLIVSKWSDVTIDLLKETVASFKSKSFNKEKLTLKYWMDQIRSASQYMI